MATTTRRGQSIDDAYKDQRRTADRAQSDARKRQLFDQLTLMRAGLLEQGVMAGALPSFNPNSSDSDYARALTQMTKLAPQKPVGSPGPEVNVAARTSLPGDVNNAPATAGSSLREGFNNVINRAKSFITGSPLDSLPKTATATAAAAPYVPKGPNGEKIRQTGAGWEAEIVGSNGQKKWVGYTPTIDQGMNVRTGGRWGGMTREQRGEELRKMPMPLEPKGRKIGGPVPVYLDELGNLTNKPTRKASFQGIDQGDGPITRFDNNEIARAPGTIVGGAGITPVEGGRLEIRNGRREITGGKYQTPGTVASATFAALPSTAAPYQQPSTILSANKPAVGSQVATTTGVIPKASTNPGTNLKGPASSTGLAYNLAPKPTAPMPITSPIAANATTPATPNAISEEERRKRRAFTGYSA